LNLLGREIDPVTKRVVDLVKIGESDHVASRNCKHAKCTSGAMLVWACRPAKLGVTSRKLESSLKSVAQDLVSERPETAQVVSYRRNEEFRVVPSETARFVLDLISRFGRIWGDRIDGSHHDVDSKIAQTC
jgi:hypothetical protein